MNLLLLCLFIVYYQLSLSLNKITKLDKMIFSYYIINLIVLVLARVTSTGNGDLAQLSVVLSSITFLQSFLGIKL